MINADWRSIGMPAWILLNDADVHQQSVHAITKAEIVIKTLLIVVTWLQGGPLIQTLVLNSPVECRIAAESAVQMIQMQARTNMTSPHNDLTAEKDEKTGEWRLSTGGIGREVARLRCSVLESVGR